jgi:DASS family divalent anion:Na+ symporter
MNNPAEKNATPTESNPQNNSSFWIKVAIGLIGTVAIALITPPEGLTREAMICLAILCGVIYFVSLGLLSEHIAGMLALILTSFFGIADFKTTFSGFSSSTFILLLGAFGMGGILTHTGVLHYLGNAIVNKFPKTFRGRVSALYLTGLIVSPTMPSGSAKGIIMSLISTPIGKQMGYKPKSRAATGMFIAGWVPVGVIGIIFLSGAVSGPLLAGMTPEGYLGEFTWTKWLMNSLVWGIVMLIGCYIANLIIYKPRPEDIDEALMQENTIDTSVAREPMTRNQKISLGVLLTVILLWILGKPLGLDNATVSLAGFVLLMLMGMVDRKGITTMVPWGTMMFIAFVLSYNSVIPAVGLGDWLTQILGGIIIPLMGNLPMFLALLCIGIYVIRTVIISQTLTTSMLYLLLMPIALEAGVNPWIIGFACAVPICIWNVLPQSVPFLAAYGAADGGGYPSFPEAAKMSVFVMVWTIVALWASIPVWKIMGLM